MTFPWYTLRKLETGRKDDMPGTNCVSGCRQDTRAAPLWLYGNDLDWCEDTRATTDGRAKKTSRQATRIGSEIAIAKDRRAARDAEAFFHYSRRQERDFQAGLAAGRSFDAQSMLVKHVTLQIKTVLIDAVCVYPQMTRALAQSIKRQPRAAPDALSSILADLSRQFREWCVDFILQKRCRSGC